MAPGLALAAASLGSQLGLSWAPPSPAQVAAIFRLLCSTFGVALDGAQVENDLGLHLSGDRRASEPSGHLQTTLKNHPTFSTKDTLKG